MYVGSSLVVHRDSDRPKAVVGWRREGRLTPKIGGEVVAPRFAFREDVEGLRGVAILLVVAFHAGLAFVPGGFVGVDVFFVLSGYLITGLLLAELTERGRVSLTRFYARRARRLLPASLTALVGTLIVVALVDAPLRIVTAAESARAAALFASNLHFAGASADYFGSTVETNPLLHTWSLSVEEQFYFVWPALVLLVAGRRRDRGRLAAALGVVSVASLAACWWYTIANRPTAFYGTPTRAWEFAIGALVALAPRTMLRRIPAALGWVGLALVGGAALRFTGRTPFPGVYALIPVVGTALVLASAPHGRVAVGRLLAVRPLQWIGRHSYAWYLWHWPALLIGATVLGPVPLSVTTKVALATGALLLAMATRAFVEEPARHARWLTRRSWRTIAIGAAAVAAVAGGAELLKFAATRATESPTQKRFMLAKHDLARPNADDCTPPLADSVVKVCTYGPPTARDTVVLFGDSHASHWFGAVDVIAHQRGWRIVVLTKSACPVYDVTEFEPSIGRRFYECTAWRRAAFDTIAARHPALAIISSTNEYVADGPWASTRATVSLDEWSRGATETLRRLRAAGVPTIVVQDTPRAIEGVPDCLARAAWLGRSGGACDMPIGDAFHRPAAEAVRRVAAGFSSVGVVDLTRALCDGVRCPTIDGDVIRWRDSNHLTDRAARRLAAAFAAALDATKLKTRF